MDAVLKNSTAMQTVNNAINETMELQKFLSEWDNSYTAKVKEIDLFKPHLTKNWTKAQRQSFIKIFYHIRGHFDSLLWYMGSFAPDYKTKEMVLNNIRDEFGNNGLSHEQLYLDFAKRQGVDLTYELLEETAYLPFVKEYIKGQLKWLRDHDWDHRLAAFAAIERLDNVDYASVRDIAISIGSTKIDLVFFNVHINAKHFEGILALAFNELWQKKPDIAQNVFSFISNYQINMWKNLSNTIFN